jgi:hypothetical protein
MIVTVAGDYRSPILLQTKKATAVFIDTEDGKPSVIFKMLSDGKGWIRLTNGEDKNFNEVAKQLGLI